MEARSAASAALAETAKAALAAAEPRAEAPAGPAGIGAEGAASGKEAGAAVGAGALAGAAGGEGRPWAGLVPLREPSRKAEMQRRPPGVRGRQANGSMFGRAKDAFLIVEGADFGQARPALERRFDALWAAAGAAWPGIGCLRLWFVGGALEVAQPPDAIAAVVGLFRPGEGARPRPTWGPTWGQRCACVQAVTLPQAAL